MRIVVVGAGTTGAVLAKRLSKNNEVHLLDLREEALEPLRKITVEEKQLDSGPLKIRTQNSDGTSRLHLRKLFDENTPTALISTSGSDEVNTEVGTLGYEIGYRPVIIIRHDSSPRPDTLPSGVTSIERGQLLADHIERSLIHRGAVVPTGIGLGRGELVEVRLVASSPVLKRKLKELAPDRWRIAAVFRGDELIVPTGETTLAVDDRVLLVGEPEQLRGIAEYIRLGTPQFPLQFGTSVISLERQGDDQMLSREAKGLAKSCPPSRWVRALPTLPRQVEDDEAVLSEPAVGAPAHAFALGDLEDGDKAIRLLEDQPGLIITRPWERNTWARLLGRRGTDAWLCDAVDHPILFARDKFPYRRVLLPVSSSSLSLRAAEVAIDITRRLEATLTAVNVDLPAYISGEPEEEAHREVEPIRRLCQLYDVPLDYRHHVGNPVKLVLEEAKHHDLIVLARRRRRRDTFFNPDVALRLARRAPCSVLVITGGPRK